MTIGRHITPTIKLIRELGKGGMGQVWAAENQVLCSLVAVKMMARNYIDDDKSIARFKQEAQRAARVRSPHVATVFDHGMTVEGEPYIVMELLEGETLSDRIKRLGSLPLDEIQALIGQIAKALAAAHKLGVVHRDIKPANLFIVDNGGEPFVKVVDFGIAKQMDAPPDMTSTNTCIGSPQYMSPEQYLNPKQVDFRTDLWSLGVVTYEALTGVPPFQGDTGIALALAITRGRFRLPSEVQPDLPTSLDDWMKKALYVSPDKRFQSAMELAKEFQSACMKPKKISIRPPNDSSAIDTTVRTPRPREVVARPNHEGPVEAPLSTPVAPPSSSLLAYARFFEGAWLSAPAGGHFYVRFIRGQLRVAYCYSGNSQLSGVYYDCVVRESSLYARFRWPEAPSLRGYIAMHGGTDNELFGGWWSQSLAPPYIATDLSKLNKSIPGMNATTWTRIRPTPPFPIWAEKYFASIAASDV